MPINSIGKTVQLLKGESAYWANKNNLIKPKLVWAEEYYAISVSDSIVPKVRSYIKSQDEKQEPQPFRKIITCLSNNTSFSLG